MRMGCQTLIFGPRFETRDSALRALDLISAFGFTGIEIAQAPVKDCLGFNDLDDILMECEKRSLSLIGMSGGALSARVAFLRDYRSPYIYIDEFTTPAFSAMRDGYRIALHPHTHCPIENFAQALPYLKHHAELLLILDTAHAAIAGDVEEIFISNMKQMQRRIAAIHLKDWTKRFGVSAYRYASGFRELGEGDLDLERIMRAAKEFVPTAWIVWELDHPTTTVQESFRSAAKWLLRTGIVKTSYGINRGFVAPAKLNSGLARPDSLALKGKTQLFFSSLVKIPQAYQHICQAAVLAGAPDVLSSRLMSVDRSSLPGHYLGGFGDVKSQGVCHGDLKQAIDARYPTRIERGGLGGPCQKYILAPVLDPNNPHFVHHLLVFDVEPRECGFTEESAWEIAHHSAIALLNAIRFTGWEACVVINSSASLCTKVEDFAERVSLHTANVLRVESAAIYLCNSLNKYRLAGACHRDWPETATQEELNKSNYHLIRGMRSRSGSLGAMLVLRLVESKDVWLNDDRDYVLDFITESAGLHISLLVGKADRDRLRERHLHSIRQPLLEIRGMLKNVQKQLGQTGQKLKHDYIGDIDSYVSLISRCCDGKKRMAADHPSDRSLVFLVRDVLASAIRQLKPTLDAHGFSHFAIDYSGMMKVPKLRVDRGDFQRLFFNLLGNAIKYAYRDASQFQVFITGKLTADHLLITVSDYGIGIRREDAPFVFEKGFRSPVVRNTSKGEGFGLHFVEEILAKYGGTIQLVHFALPTKFQIQLPIAILN